MTQEKIESFTDESRTAGLSDEYGPGNERWEMRPLSEFIEPVLGKTPKRSEDEYWGGDIQWASAKDISQSETRHVYDTEENMTEAGKEASNAKTLPEGTVVVIARGATMGRVAQLGGPMTFNQTCYALDTNDQLLDDYLYYAWQYVFGQVQAVSYGTVFDTITMKSFDDIEIPLPPLNVQEDIAGRLTKFDDRIDEANRIMESCLKFSEYLFEDQFGSDIGSGNRPLSKFVERASNSVHPEDHPDTQYLLYDFSSYDSTRCPTITEGDDINSRKYSVPDNSVLLSKLNPRIPRVWYIPKVSDSAICSTEFVILDPQNDSTQDFIFALARSSTFRDYLESHITGTSGSHQRVKIDDIMSFKIGSVTDAEIEEFSRNCRPYHQKWVVESQMKQTLKEIRDTLLPKLLSGSIPPTT